MRRFDTPSLLYLFMAVALGSLGFFRFYLLSLTGDPFAIADIFLTMVVTLFFTSMFIIAALVGLRNPIWASKMAFRVTLLLLACYAYMAYPYVFGEGVLSLLKLDVALWILVPGILFSIAALHSRWAASNDAAIGPIAWFRATQQGKLRLALLASTLALTPVIVVLNLFFRDQVATITYEAAWEIEPLLGGSHCPDGYTDRVRFKVNEVPGYEINFCTEAGGAAYLKTDAPDVVPVVFEIRYDMFRRNSYKVIQVGDWVGEGVSVGIICIFKDNRARCNTPDVMEVTDTLFHYNRTH